MLSIRDNINSKSFKLCNVLSVINSSLFQFSVQNFTISPAKYEIVEGFEIVACSKTFYVLNIVILLFLFQCLDVYTPCNRSFILLLTVCVLID